jgi:2-oxoglutarate/2-oxoacid ferredoxin oxidoreductase subunit alpha
MMARFDERSDVMMELRDQYLVDAKPLTTTSGQPFKNAEIVDAIEGALG